METWIETDAGNLVKASSVTHIVVRKNGESWEVSVSASAAPAPFATGLPDEKSARSVRNMLVLKVSTPGVEGEPQIVVYAQETGTVTACSVAL